jgi:hypothetical protein
VKLHQIRRRKTRHILEIYLQSPPILLLQFKLSREASRTARSASSKAAGRDVRESVPGAALRRNLVRGARLLAESFHDQADQCVGGGVRQKDPGEAERVRAEERDRAGQTDESEERGKGGDPCGSDRQAKKYPESRYEKSDARP